MNTASDGENVTEKTRTFDLVFRCLDDHDFYKSLASSPEKRRVAKLMKQVRKEDDILYIQHLGQEYVLPRPLERYKFIQEVHSYVHKPAKVDIQVLERKFLAVLTS